MTTTDELAPEPESDKLPSRIIDRVVGMNSDLARQHIARFGGGKSGSALLRRLDRQYRTGVTGSGAGVGAAAAAPGVGTAVSLALSGAEAVAALEATMVYVLAYAEVTGIHVDDVERRRTLLLGVLLGQSGQRTIEKVAGRTGPHWARKVVQSVPMETVKKVNAVLGHNFIVKYGTKQGIIVLGRAIPFGIGAGIGAAMGAVNSTLVIKATRRAFDQVPATESDLTATADVDEAQNDGSGNDQNSD